VKPHSIRRDSPVDCRQKQPRFVEAAKQHENGEAFILMLGTGMRIGETLALTWDDIDLEKAEVRVNKTQVDIVVDPSSKIPKKGISYGPPKTNASYRTIPLLPQLVKMLEEHREKQTVQSSEMGGSYTENNLVFCTRFGTDLASRQMRDKLDRITKKVEIKSASSKACCPSAPPCSLCQT